MLFRRRSSPLRSLGTGLLAGAVGSLAQSLFFASTRRLARSLPPGDFTPPEASQATESETETVARRVSEGLARRSLDARWKSRAGQLVHVAFGAMWGGFYGLTADSTRLRAPLAVPLFSLLVWGMSDNIILPAFRVAGPAHAYRLPRHAYAIAAHLVYGTAVATAFAALRPRSIGAARGLWKWRSVPRFVRRPARRVLVAAHRSGLARPLVSAAAAFA